MNRMVPLAIAIALVFAPAIHADTVSVQCGADPATLPLGTYSSLNAALAALSLQGPHTINVTGTCHENVNNGLQSRERLEIQGPAGGTATIENVDNPASWVLAVGRSRQITLRRLIVRGGQVGIRIDSASSVDIIDCIAEDNGQGVFVDENSTVRMNRVTIRNNEGDGLFVSRGSDIAFSLGGPDPAFVHIHGNGIGINVNNGSVTVQRAATIENNAGGSIALTAGRLQMSGPAGGGNIVRNNGFGINAVGSSSVLLSGGNTIQNNGSAGIQIGRSSSLSIGGGQAPGTPFTTVEGHSTVGINIVQGSAAAITGNHKIRNNGFAPARPEAAGGIRVGSSTLNLAGTVEVSNNQGTGITVDLNATLTISPGTGSPAIAGNTAEGIRLTGLSVASFLQAPIMSGKPDVSITCDRSSWLFGDTTGIEKIKCGNDESKR